MTINERRNIPLWKKLIAILFSLILFAIQAGIIFVFFYYYGTLASNVYQGLLGVIYLGSLLFGLVYILTIIARPISTNYKITWAILILLAPIPFCTLYTLNALSRARSNRKQKKINDALNKITVPKDVIIPDDEIANMIVHNIQTQTYAPLCRGNKVTFYNDALKKHEAMLEDLKKAENFILMEYFIINDGKCFNDIYTILKQKGEAGVKIYILFDDVGSMMLLSKKISTKLSSIPNLTVNNFSPLTFNFDPLINYRDHRKICCIDGMVTYTGGDNLSDEYIHNTTRFGFWRDNACRFEGDVALTFIDLFVEMWYISTDQIIKGELEIPNTYTIYNNNYVVGFGDGPTVANDVAYKTFFNLILHAKKYAYISTPYLIIDDAMISLMALKAENGVDVRILVPGIPDKKAVFYMSRAHYKKLLRAGVKIYEFSPGFNHAKNVIVDDKYAFVGTVNMDYRSMFLHYECGAVIINDPEVLKMHDDFIDALNKSKEVNKTEWEKRPLHQWLIAFILNMIAPFF